MKDLVLQNFIWNAAFMDLDGKSREVGTVASTVDGRFFTPKEFTDQPQTQQYRQQGFNPFRIF